MTHHLQRLDVALDVKTVLLQIAQYSPLIATPEGKLRAHIAPNRIPHPFPVPSKIL